MYYQTNPRSLKHTRDTDYSNVLLTNDARVQNFNYRGDFLKMALPNIAELCSLPSFTELYRTLLTAEHCSHQTSVSVHQNTWRRRKEDGWRATDVYKNFYYRGWRGEILLSEQCSYFDTFARLLSCRFNSKRNIFHPFNDALLTNIVNTPCHTVLMTYAYDDVTQQKQGTSQLLLS